MEIKSLKGPTAGDKLGYKNGTKVGTKSGTKKSAAESRAERVQLVLSAITDDPYATIRSLAEDLGIPKNTVSRIMRGLQEDGMIKREGSARKGCWVVL